MRVTRCPHGMIAKLCVVSHCPHHDGRTAEQPTYRDRSARLRKRRDRARERYAQKRQRQERLADAIVEAKERAS